MDIELKLAEECDHWDYDYSTHESIDYERRDCPKCKGKGEIPTELGEKLLNFIRTHLI